MFVGWHGERSTDQIANNTIGSGTVDGDIDAVVAPLMMALITEKYIPTG